jgi:acyl-[acyl-carrier-protein]-phospholipid O-acyltransferase/long-chain-fatty-acid--[acyl-carrier-protein] ligase
MLRQIFHLLLRVCFRFRAYGIESLKTPGPVLLVPNHVSWLDFLFLWVLLDLDWKFVVSRVAARLSWLHRQIMLNRRTFPIDPASPYALKRIAEHLQGGGRLVLFAEGQISRTGCLMKLFDGTGFLLHKTRARVITCYLRGANRLKWSRQPGWRRWWPAITVHFSEVLDPPRLEGVSTARARATLTTWLRDRMVAQQFDTEMAFGPATVPAAILETARRVPNFRILEDATMQPITYRRLLIGAELLGARLAARLSEGERVGVLLPNVNALPVTLLGLWAHGRVPAILNFTTGVPTMLACAQLAGLRQVVTSRAFLERARLRPEPFAEAGLELVYLEDLRAEIGGPAKLVAALRMRLAPGSLLRPAARPKVRIAKSETPLSSPENRGPEVENAGPASGIRPPASGGGAPAASQQPAVILFTSGSEGVPKGVVLTHANLLANIRQMLAVIDVTDHDRVFNALPTFHSFGLTVGLLLGLVRGLYVFLYPSPLHYRLLPNVLYDRHCTVFLATNTFLNGYARRAHPFDFRALRYLFAGAEKVQEETARVWAQRFGVRILEGYGATECSPVISVNTPMAPKHGTAGRLLPGMELRLEPVEGVPDAGRLWVRGPNVMRGYLNPEADAAFRALGGWYDTGDIVSVDEEGFLTIRGRLKRFAKVSGEMVSLTAVEDALAGAFPQYGPRCEVAVLARPDEDKGEALVAVTNEPRLRLDEIRAALRARGLPNLCVPREVVVVKEIPKLGTGKVNHRELARRV